MTHRLFFALAILLSAGCRPAPESSPPQATAVPAAVSEASVHKFEMEQARMVLLGERLNQAEVAYALSVLRSREKPQPKNTVDPAANSFTGKLTNSEVVEVYPHAGIEVTLKENRVISVRPWFEEDNLLLGSSRYLMGDE